VSEREPSPPSPLPRERGGAAPATSFVRGTWLTARAQDLRRAMTDAERRLWAGLRGDRLGVRFRRQLPLGQRYIADFCAPELKLIIEVDGGQHADSLADASRTRDLEALGYTVLRFWNPDVLRDTDAVVQAICDHITALRGATGNAPPLSCGRGDGGEGLSTDQPLNGKS
jgi:very-short-patch-repair endonuclease